MRKTLFGLTPEQMGEVWFEVECQAYMDDLQIILDEYEEFKGIELTDEELHTIAKHLVYDAYLDFDYLGEASEAIRAFLKEGKLW